MISGPQRPLEQFTPSQLTGYRRVFAHCADIFYARYFLALFSFFSAVVFVNGMLNQTLHAPHRGVANPTTGEVSSLSCEPCSGGELIVAVFEVPGSDDFVKVRHTTTCGQYFPSLSICRFVDQFLYTNR